ncbi:hypothetical protein [Pedosphaera parvula]|nr:hypothetical protein [Pedosphaera parvula]
MKITVRAIVAVFALFALSAFADEALWTAALVHYDVGQDEWAIYPAVEPTPPQRFVDVLQVIHSKDKKGHIHSIALGKFFTRADLQSDVVAYLQKQKLFQTSPPPFGHNRWNFKNSGEMQRLVSDALLQSRFVDSLNRDLAAYKWKITSAGMEKLFFTKEDEKIVWHAIVSFSVTKQ